MKRKTIFGFFIVCLSALVLSGCMKPWDIQKMARPNPFRGDAQFFILPIRYVNLRVGRLSERAFLARKNDKDARNWEIIRNRVVDLCMDSFLRNARGLPVEHKGKPHARDFVIVPTVSYVDPGFYAFASRPSEIELRVAIVYNRRILDEVFFRSSTDAYGATYYVKGFRRMPVGGTTFRTLIPTRASVASRLETDARYLGMWLAGYLRWRLKQKK